MSSFTRRQPHRSPGQRRKLFTTSASNTATSPILRGLTNETSRARGSWLGHAAAVSPPPPWLDRSAALRRNQELQQIWQRQTSQPPSNETFTGAPLLPASEED